MLTHGTARYSTPLAFNDPFDVQAGLHFDFDPLELHDAVVDRIGELAALEQKPFVDTEDPWGQMVLLAHKYFPKNGFSRDRWIGLTKPAFDNLLPIIHDTQVKYQRNWQEEQLPGIRVFCVSEDRDNLLMWAHYAKDHRGAVFELWSLPDEDNSLSAAVPVQYVNSPIPFYSKTDWVDDLVSVRRLDIRSLYQEYACTKSSHWSYEKEWRVWYPLSKTDTYDYLPIRRSELKAVYMGCQSELALQETVSHLLRVKYPEARLFLARKSDSRYTLEYAEA
jgi:hypothetical protein